MENAKGGFLEKMFGIFEAKINDILKTVGEKLNSEFEKECMIYYLKKSGLPMIVKDDVFERIAAVAVKEQEKAGGKLAGATPITIDGKPYYTKCISFYGDREFDYALGCATIFFDENGTPVGLRDRYDFDPKPGGHRGDQEEKLTQIMAELEKTRLGGKPYDILYGIHD